MNNKKAVSAETLSEVKYGDLLAKFTELGIPEAWKPGKKKSAMIKAAIEKLAIIRSLEDRGLEQEEIAEQLIVVQDKKIQAEEQEQLEIAQAQEVADKAIVQKVQKSGLTQDQIKQNLNVIKQNLMSNIPAHRDILLKKQEALTALLED